MATTDPQATATTVNAATYNPSYTNAATYGTTQATANDYSAAGASPVSTYDASTAQGTNADATYRTVAPDETVQSQLNGIIDSNSPLIRQARAYANDNSAARGLINSSMATGAATGAVIQSALPIAQQDASTYSTNAINNQNVANQTSQFNANLGQQNNQYNAGLITGAMQNNAQATNTQNLQTQNLQTGANANNAQAGTQVSLANASAQNSANAGNAAAVNTANQFNATSANTANQSNVDSINKVNAANQAAVNQVALANLDTSTRTTLQQMTNAANATQGGQAISTQLLASISAIQSDANLDGPSKTQAINNLIGVAQQSLNVAGAATSLNLGSLLNFSASDPTAAQTAAQAVTPAAAPLTSGNDGGG